MNFNKHLNIKGHAFMGASQYQWLRYDDNKIAQVYINALAKAIKNIYGTTSNKR